MPLPINIHELFRGRSVEVGGTPSIRSRPSAPLPTIFTIWEAASYIVVGVEEQAGRPVLPPKGLDPESIDAIQKEILYLGHSAIQPMYHPVIVPYEVGGRTILVIWAPGGQTRPYKAKLSLAKENREWGYFIRKGSSTVRAKGRDEIELLSLASTVPFDDRINQRARVEDLSRHLMREFLAEVGSDLASQAESLPLLELARQMQVVGGPDEAPSPFTTTTILVVI